MTRTLEKSQPVIWVLSSPFLGETNNRLAVARAASANALVASFSSAAGDTNGAEKVCLEGEYYPFGAVFVPDIVIVGGQVDGCHSYPAIGKIFEIAAQQGKQRPFIVGMQTPDIDRNDFDTSCYREIVEMQILFRHLPSTVASMEQGNEGSKYGYDFVPSRITPETLETARGRNPGISALTNRGPVYTVALASLIHSTEISGCSDHGALMELNLRYLLRTVAAAAKSNDGSVLITTSPRACAQFMPVIRGEMRDVPHYIHDWSGDGANPYHTMLDEADHIVVSGDSMSMVSDAMVTGKPVYVFAPSDGRDVSGFGLVEAFSDNSLIKTEVRNYMAKLAQLGLIRSIEDLSRNGTGGLPQNSAQQMAHDMVRAWHSRCRIA